MNIIHIASFKGNIGDTINHVGFYQGLNRYLTSSYLINQIEIRKFYNNCQELKFNSNLAKKINKNNLLILGGGGFFDVRWNNSATGTTLDMSNEFIEQIKIPVLFNGIGFHCFGESRQNRIALKKFYDFIMEVKRKSNWKITLRNDGSAKRMVNIYGKDIIKSIETVPDNGFFFCTSNYFCMKKNGITIGVNFTSDLFEKIFTSGITEHSFIDDIVKILNILLERGYKIIFFAHTPQDIDIIYQCKKEIKNHFFREQIILAPYYPFDEAGARQLESYYRLCDVIIAMRFHANILAFQSGIPVVSLAGHEQIETLCEELGTKKYCVRIGENQYTEKVIEILDSFLENSHYYMIKVKEKMNILKREQERYIKEIQQFVRSCAYEDGNN